MTGQSGQDASWRAGSRPSSVSLLLKNWRPAAQCAQAGNGSPDRCDLRLEDGLIVALGPDLPPLPLDLEIDLQGAVVVPGLVDCHVHLSLGRAGVAKNARTHLAAGVTALRSLGDRSGSEGLGSAAGESIGSNRARLTGNWVVDERSQPMPVAVFAGRALTPTGRYGGFLGREVQPGEPLASLVEQEVAGGARVVKVILSGSVDFERGTAEGPYFSERELAEIVAAARSLGVPVACHANGYPSVRLAAAAGVSSVEHGILAGAEGVRAMADAGTCWVPTLTPLHNLVAEGRWADLPAILERHSTAVSHGVELGMSILPGTDAGSPGVPHGSLPTELGLLAAAGLSGDALLAAATWRAADLLGLPRGYGRLAIGASTDLVWFERDPCRDTWRLGPPLGAVLAGRLAAGTELSSSV